jgi:hypothetical protein
MVAAYLVNPAVQSMSTRTRTPPEMKARKRKGTGEGALSWLPLQMCCKREGDVLVGAKGLEPSPPRSRSGPGCAPLQGRPGLLGLISVPSRLKRAPATTSITELNWSESDRPPLTHFNSWKTQAELPAVSPKH